MNKKNTYKNGAESLIQYIKVHMRTCEDNKKNETAKEKVLKGLKINTYNLAGSEKVCIFALEKENKHNLAKLWQHTLLNVSFIFY